MQQATDNRRYYLPNLAFFVNSKMSLNPFPHDKILNQTNMKAFADNKIVIKKLIISVFDRVEKHCGKGRNCLYKQFLLFPERFQKTSFRDLSRGVIVVNSGKLP